MKIKHHVKKTFETTDAYAEVDSIEKRLRDNSFLVVLNEDSFMGILTPSDIIKSIHKQVIDCLYDKPRIDCEQDIELVLKIMKDSHNFVLPVFNGDVFIGIVLQASITDFLLEYHGELERAISKRTAELKKANEQLKREVERYKNSKKKLRESKESFIAFAENLPEIVYERKRSEKEKKKLQAQLQQVQRLESLGTLAGGIAHDFNNLLMGIQGNVSLMLLDIDSTHPFYKRFKNIEDQVKCGARLTSHLLGYARKGKYRIELIYLNQLLEEISNTFAHTRKNITIRRDFAEDLSPIEADQKQIEQVLLNLIINASDAMRGGGSLILKTMNVTHMDMNGKVYEPKPGNYVLLTVTDTGIGMDKKTQERIFDPFFTTKNKGRGTGLGLACAYGIVKAHGGYIDVESKKGQGTTFGIYLPAHTKTADEVIE